jgi:hypothetical protein
MSNDLKLLTIADLEDLPDPDWLLQDAVQVGSFLNLYGPPKSGKSFIALDWGLSIAAGIPWLEHEVREGPVVYVYAENPAGLKQRVPAWCEAHGGVKPTAFYMLPSRVNIANATERRRLQEAIAGVLGEAKPALIIIDTLAKCFGPGDENSNTDLGRFVDGCEDLRERFDCAVAVVHHAGKKSEAGSRGATALPGAIDAQFEVTKRADGKIKLHNEMQRDAVEHPDMWLVLTPSLRSVVVEKTTAPGKAEKARKPTNRDKVAEVLVRHPEGLSGDQWRAEAEVAGVAKTPFYKAKGALIEEGVVTSEAGKFVLALPLDGDVRTTKWKPHVRNQSGFLLGCVSSVA